MTSILTIIFLCCLMAGFVTMCGIIRDSSRADEKWVDCTHPVEARVVDYNAYGDIDTDNEYFFVKVEYEYDGMQYRGRLRFKSIGESNWEDVKSKYPIRSVRTIYVEPGMPTNISATRYTGDRMEYWRNHEEYERRRARFMWICFGVSVVLGIIIFMPYAHLM